MKDFYKELDKALKSYEEYKPYHPMDMFAISDKITWCWKWRKISKEQMEELADRMCAVFENN